MKKVFDINPLTDVMQRLREPGGCPWDREQDHRSIRQNFIEEVYEYLEAVDEGDFAGMREELGDVLMQVVFHCRMAQEAGRFDLQDVIDEVVAKLIRRHPHVYGTVEVEGSAQVLKNWDAIKKTEKQDRHSVLDGVTKDLPGLLRAHKLQHKAAKVGFDWERPEDCWQKILEEMQEVQQARQQGQQEHLEEEIGDLLFAVVNYARQVGVNSEVAINRANNKFLRRFGYVEAKVDTSGKNWEGYKLEELDNLWNDAKRQGL